MRLFSLLILLWAGSAHAITTESVQQLIDHYLPDAHVGVFVQRIDTGEVLVNVNGDKHFTPASTTKLFTSYTALKQLGPTFQFHTTLFLDPTSIQQGIYRSPIYLTFSGDPGLTSAHIAEFVAAIKTAGITQIDGPIILDISSVPAPYYGRGWANDDLAWYYGAPVNAAIIDENKIRVELITQQTPGQPMSARVISNPSIPITTHLVSATLENTASTCQLNTSIDSTNHLLIYGCWPVSDKPALLEMAISNPTLRVQQIIKTHLQAQHIIFNGEIKEGNTPTTGPLFSDHLSPPLSELIIPVLRDSHNLYADALNKQIGLNTLGHATFQAGSHATEQMVYKTFSLPAKSIAFFDGSGESTYNLVTPAALAALLYGSYKDDAIRPLFLNALAVSGKSGTLMARMKEDDLVGRFIGKTGSLSHVFNLAGYFYPDNQQSPIIVVFLINNTTEGQDTVKAFENALLRLLF